MTPTIGGFKEGNTQAIPPVDQRFKISRRVSFQETWVGVPLGKILNPPVPTLYFTRISHP